MILLSGCMKNMTLSETVGSLKRMAGNAVLIFCVDYMQDDEVEECILKSGVDGIVVRPFFLSNLETAMTRTITDSVSETENTSILKGMRFLWAEDNELNAEILKEILKMYGASCTIYPDGEAIVEAFKNVKPGYPYGCADAEDEWSGSNQSHQKRKQSIRKDNPDHCHDSECIFRGCAALHGRRYGCPYCETSGYRCVGENPAWICKRGADSQTE